MKNFDYKNENGRSMIEMLGVLAIIGVLSVGGIAGYSKAMTKYRINKTIEQITIIAGNVRAFWGPQKNYDGVDCNSNWDGTCNASGCSGQSSNDGCPIVKKAKIFPDEMITVTDGKIMSITNPFGYGVSIGTDYKSKSGDNQAFSIFYILPEEACIDVITHDWRSVNIGAIYASSDNDYAAPTPIPIDEATVICDNGPLDVYFYADIDVNSTYWQNQFTNYREQDIFGN